MTERWSAPVFLGVDYLANENFRLPAAALLGGLVGKPAFTIFLADLEGHDLVLHARHRRSKVVIKVWSGGSQCHGKLAKPYRDEDFLGLAARCLAKVVRAAMIKRGMLLERAAARVAAQELALEQAMAERVRRNRDWARVRAEKPRPPGLLRRLARIVFFL